MAKRKKNNGIDFEGFEELAEKLDSFGGRELERGVESALIATQRIMTPGIKTAIAPHHLTGDTEASIKQSPRVEWTGTVASVDIGFNISDGGLPSVFLMYGTPKMSPDKKLYNAFFGGATKKKVRKAQEEVIHKIISRVFT